MVYQLYNSESGQLSRHRTEARQSSLMNWWLEHHSASFFLFFLFLCLCVWREWRGGPTIWRDLLSMEKTAITKNRKLDRWGILLLQKSPSLVFMWAHEGPVEVPPSLYSGGLTLGAIEDTLPSPTFLLQELINRQENIQPPILILFDSKDLQRPLILKMSVCAQ